MVLSSLKARNGLIFCAVGVLAMAAATPAAQTSRKAQTPLRLTANPAFKLAIAPQGYDCSTGTSAPYYCLGGENDSTKNGFTYGVYGLEGYASNATGGIGVLGYSGNANVNTAYGVYGVSFSPDGIGVYGAGDGPTPAPATTPNSSNVTTGLAGDSHAGDGIFASTEWPGESTITNVIAGVVGVDNANSGSFNNGVVGTTTNGGYGGLFSSVSGAEGALGAFSNGDTAVTAVSTSSEGVNGSSTSDYGVEGDSTDEVGVYGKSLNTGSNYPNDAGVKGFGAFDGFYTATATASGGNVTYGYIQQDANGDDTFNVDNSGNVTIFGALKVHGGTSTFTRTRNPDVQAQSYSAATTHPTVEDVGEARIVNGAGYVHLDPTFAQSIDDRSPYSVFLTPEGDTKGLYVTGKSLGGFTVRESQSGRSTVDFSYRIVASPYGDTGRRMAFVTKHDLAMLSTNYGHTLHARRPHIIPAKARAAIAEFRANGTGFVRAFRPKPNLYAEHRMQ